MAKKERPMGFWEFCDRNENLVALAILAITVTLIITVPIACR